MIQHFLLVNRLFWIIAFIVSLCLSGYLISEPWRKWHDSPVIVSFDEKATPIWKIHFPAVTICPESKFNFDKLNYTNAFQMVFNNETDQLSDDM